MTTAPDTEDERLAEYRRLFSEVLVGRERTETGIRFRFHANPGVEAWVCDLAAREKACCAFFAFEISVVGQEVVWDMAVVDNDMARAILDQFYELPVTLANNFDDVRDRFADLGLEVISQGSVRLS
ncbi:hypothetical protein DMH04_44125 [Kibdelosporangium aridum]|uniref:Uncharacterized protein n=1 Tax=Kibdelosporangium aridum TaxID=2030 RepID=A0A428YQG8_KIBAR|nr:hypothetical protein [Kibdelosporangium aridum]RSM70800.1 hypothetical protein DMH04_44125 [Kibdelosporangium aridum]